MVAGFGEEKDGYTTGDLNEVTKPTVRKSCANSAGLPVSVRSV